MKVKKIFSVVIALVLCVLDLSIVDFNSYADNEVKEVYLSTLVNGASKRLPAIQNANNNLFLSGTTLSDITVYNNSDVSTAFRHDNADSNNRYREILISKSEKKASIFSFYNNAPNSYKEISLSEVIEYNDDIYLPVTEILPLLNTRTFVNENTLVIEDVPYSMTNIMQGFNVQDYLFDLYDDDDFFGMSDAQILAGYSYFFNSLVNFKLNRFIPVVSKFDKIDTYTELMEKYLVEDSTYIEAIGEDETSKNTILSFLDSKEYEAFELIKDAFEPLAEISDDEHKELLKTFTNLDSYDFTYSTINDISKFSKEMEFGINLAAYAELYVNHVTDHYDMLDSVFDITQKKTLSKKEKKEASFKAAEKLYSKYSQDEGMKVKLFKYIAGESAKIWIDEFKGNFIEKTIEEYSKNEIAQIADGLITKYNYAKLGAVICKLTLEYFEPSFYVATKHCEYLGNYNQLMEKGYSKYAQYRCSYDFMNSSEIENCRLSLIFTLLSSRSMYQAMVDTSKAYDMSGSVYQKKIDAINDMLTKLYRANGCCSVDSIEYIQQTTSDLKANISKVDVSETSGEELYGEFDKAVFGALAQLTNNNFKLKNYIVNDADNDNELELFVSSDTTNNIDNPSVLIFENPNKSELFYLPPPTMSRYDIVSDVENDKVMVSEGYADVDFTYIEYSEWNNNSLKSFAKYVYGYKDGNSTAPTIQECYWNNVNTTENDFMANFERMTSTNSEIFNIYINNSIDNTVSAFEKYLSSIYSIEESIQCDINGDGNNEVIITVSNLANLWYDRAMSLQKPPEYDWVTLYNWDTPKNQTTTFFVIDEYDGKTRIRSENYNIKLVPYYENSNIFFKNDLGNIMKYEHIINDDTLTSSFLTISENSEFYGVVGIVNTESTGLNLRKNRGQHSEIICEIPKDSKVSILSSSIIDAFIDAFNENNDTWYLIEWNGTIGYVKSDYILTTNDKIKLNKAHLIAIAQMLYYDGKLSLSLIYEPCFTVDSTKGFNADYTTYSMLNGIKTKNDLFNNVHKLFSKKYDAFYDYDQYFDSEYYIELDGNWYINDAVHRKGNLPLDALIYYKHDALNLEITSINDNEVFFKGFIDWSKADSRNEYAITMSHQKTDLSEFSIVYEDNVWKCGKLDNLSL